MIWIVSGLIVLAVVEDVFILSDKLPHKKKVKNHANNRR